MKKLVLILLASAGLLAAPRRRKRGIDITTVTVIARIAMAGMGIGPHRITVRTRTAITVRPIDRPLVRIIALHVITVAITTRVIVRSATTRRVRGFPSSSDSKASRCAELEHLGDNIVAGCSFRLAFEVEDDAVTQGRDGGILDVGRATWNRPSSTA